MDVLTALILGIIQGITEWLPISSSAHLVIMQRFMNVENPVLFDAVVHLGTLLAVILASKNYIYIVIKSSLSALRGDFIENLREDSMARAGYGAIMGSIPIIVIGLIFQNYVEESFNSIFIVAVALPITGIIIFSVKNRDGRRNSPSIKDSLIIGISQALALVPGISRSGITIAAGIHLGLDRKSAARFSFLMAIIAISGAGAFQIIKAINSPVEIYPAILVTGFLSSFIIGYLSIKTLLKMVVTDKFHYFAYYCWSVGVFLWLYIYFL